MVNSARSSLRIPDVTRVVFLPGPSNSTLEYVLDDGTVKVSYVEGLPILLIMDRNSVTVLPNRPMTVKSEEPLVWSLALVTISEKMATLINLGDPDELITLDHIHASETQIAFNYGVVRYGRSWT